MLTARSIGGTFFPDLNFEKFESIDLEK